MFRTFAAALLVVAVTSASIAVPAPTHRDESEKAFDSRDKIVCKRFVETGSLVKGTRTCKTKREWERDRDNLRAPATSGSTCSQPGAISGC